MSTIARAARAARERHRAMLGRALRFLVVALINNGLSYLLFVLLLRGGLGAGIALATAYIMSVVLTFFANRRYSFRDKYGSPRQFIAYVAVYGFCYAANILALRLARERLGLPEQTTQIAMIFIIGGFIFLVLHFIVFAPQKPRVAGD